MNESNSEYIYEGKPNLQIKAKYYVTKTNLLDVIHILNENIVTYKTLFNLLTSYKYFNTIFVGEISCVI